MEPILPRLDTTTIGQFVTEYVPSGRYQMAPKARAIAELLRRQADVPLVLAEFLREVVTADDDSERRDALRALGPHINATLADAALLHVLAEDEADIRQRQMDEYSAFLRAIIDNDNDLREGAVALAQSKYWQRISDGIGALAESISDALVPRAYETAKTIPRREYRIGPVAALLPRLAPRDRRNVVRSIFEYLQGQQTPDSELLVKILPHASKTQRKTLLSVVIHKLGHNAAEQLRAFLPIMKPAELRTQLRLADVTRDQRQRVQIALVLADAGAGEQVVIQAIIAALRSSQHQHRTYISGFLSERGLTTHLPSQLIKEITVAMRDVLGNWRWL